MAAAAKSSSGKGFSGASKDSRSAPVVAPGPTQTREQDAGSQEGAIYARPELYDAAFSYRDFKEEAKFLRDMYKQHAQGVPLSAVLDLGCGPSRHLLGLAKAGVPTCVGVDLSSDMLAYARGLVDKAGLKDAASVTLQQGDMTNFVVPGKEGTFDMAMCLLGTFSHLTENAQAAASFACVFRHLRPGGLFVLELAHPGDLFDGTLIIGDGAKEAWEVPQVRRGTHRCTRLTWPSAALLVGQRTRSACISACISMRSACISMRSAWISMRRRGVNHLASMRAQARAAPAP